MNIKKLLPDFTITFIVTLVTNLVVTYLYNLLVHNSSVIDWETSIRFGLILGIVLPLVNKRK
jgi:hypothetical protein